MSSIEFSSLTLLLEKKKISEDTVLILSFDGQITNTNAYEINAKIKEIFKEKEYNLILDLSRLDYINSIGVATLLSMINTVDINGGKISIGGLNPFLENVLKLMDLPKSLKIYSKKETAISNWI
jgi:anti-anti-sigma factor